MTQHLFEPVKHAANFAAPVAGVYVAEVGAASTSHILTLAALWISIIAGVASLIANGPESYQRARQWLRRILGIGD